MGKAVGLSREVERPVYPFSGRGLDAGRLDEGVLAATAICRCRINRDIPPDSRRFRDPERAFDPLTGFDLLAHVAPLGWEHIGLTGDYVWTEANPAAPFRPLREVRPMFQPQAA